jgi:hypothetical protein
MGQKMKLDILIDKLTPCLVEAATGEVKLTTFNHASMDDVSGLKKKGWLFDWNARELLKYNTYKLLVNGDDTIQGLVSMQVERGAVHVYLVESAPHNKGDNKIYKGVGGHLFAIAIKLSLANGFGGYIYFDAKNMELVKHYSEMLNATRVLSRIHAYRMEVLESEAKAIIDKYSLEGDLN